MISSQWDIVRVPFPFTDQMAVKKRPALVISSKTFNVSSKHSIMAMITKAQKSDWLNDYTIENWDKAGLKMPSLIRFKLFTLENSLIIDTLGTLQPSDITGFKACFSQIMC
jgi:mRNA interferase MazF